MAAATFGPIAAAPAATAATATVDDQGKVTFSDDRGEVNRVSVRGGAQIVIEDTAATIVAGPGCSALTDRAVACAAETAQVDLGPSDDTGVSDPNLEIRLGGGPGDDRLRGPWLYGDDGDDRLVADDHVVRLVGGLGDDLIDARPAVASASRRSPLGDFNVLLGGGGADTIKGGRLSENISHGPGPDVVDAGPGDDSVGDGFSMDAFDADDDVLDGGPGNDGLRSNEGDDVVSGSSGSDLIHVGDVGINASPLIPLGRGDRVECDSDIDQVIADYYDEVNTDCEEATHGTPEWRSLRPLRGSQFVVKVRCAWNSARPCRGRARIVGWRRGTGRRNPWLPPRPGALPSKACRGTHAMLAAGAFEIRAGRVNRATLELRPAGRRLLRRRRCVAAHLVLNYADVRGGTREMTRSVTVRLR
jgi:hypothetical protein